MSSWIHTLTHKIVRSIERHEDVLDLFLRHANTIINHSHFNQTFIIILVQSLLEIDNICFDYNSPTLLEFDRV